jgi:hypothetical protein
MSHEAQSNGRQVEASVIGLTDAYSNNQLHGYRVLELKDSLDEQTTCLVQWGPQMRT